MSDFRAIVCATDFSEPAEAALRRAVDLASPSAIPVHLVHVFRYPYIDYPWYSDTVPDAIEANGGTFDAGSRTFTFDDPMGTTRIRFQSPDRFTVETTVGGSVVESYVVTRT